ncbi:MAG: sigma-70 family RNA polymerase sigma factor [Bryobacteraceae bacterium]
MRPETPDHEITQLLAKCRGGNKDAEARLLALVYQQLREMARHHMRREGPGHTLQTTALVHEVYLRLFGKEIDWQNRSHFFAVAAQMMRRVLVDHARARKASKRGSGARVDLEDVPLISEDRLEDVLAVDQALERLAGKDLRQAKMVELHLFAGLTLQETADVLGVARRTIQRDWDFAQAWLYNEMRPAR